MTVTLKHIHTSKTCIYLNVSLLTHYVPAHGPVKSIPSPQPELDFLPLQHQDPQVQPGEHGIHAA